MLRLRHAASKLAATSSFPWRVPACFSSSSPVSGVNTTIPTDLWDTLVAPTPWDVTDSFTPDVPHDARRENMELAWFGKTRGDKECMDASVLACQAEVNKLLMAKDVDDTGFERIAVKLLRHLETLDGHRFGVAPFLAFNGPKSPNYDLQRQVYRRLFVTAHSAHHGKVRENYSGFAVAGRLGVGKTDTLLRPAALVGGLLLPNVQTLSLDLSTVKERQDVTKWSQRALAEVGIETSATMNSVVNAANMKRCALALFLDEVPELYASQNERAWCDINTFVKTTIPTFAVVTGSSSMLPMLVCAAPVKQIKELFDMDRVFPMLNKDKLKLEPFHPLRTEDHYRQYLEAKEE